MYNFEVSCISVRFIVYFGYLVYNSEAYAIIKLFYKWQHVQVGEFVGVQISEGSL